MNRTREKPMETIRGHCVQRSALDESEISNVYTKKKWVGDVIPDDFVSVARPSFYWLCMLIVSTEWWSAYINSNLKWETIKLWSNSVNLNEHIGKSSHRNRIFRLPQNILWITIYKHSTDTQDSSAATLQWFCRRLAGVCTLLCRNLQIT